MYMYMPLLITPFFHPPLSLSPSLSLSLPPSLPPPSLPPGGDTASDLLIQMSGALDDFYPAVAISALMKILKDQSLSQHHIMAIQALVFVFKSLGIKSVPYLPQVRVRGEREGREGEEREWRERERERERERVKEERRKGG